MRSDARYSRSNEHASHPSRLSAVSKGRALPTGSQTARESTLSWEKKTSRATKSVALDLGDLDLSDLSEAIGQPDFSDVLPAIREDTEDLHLSISDRKTLRTLPTLTEEGTVLPPVDRRSISARSGPRFSRRAHQSTSASTRESQRAPSLLRTNSASSRGRGTLTSLAAASPGPRLTPLQRLQMKVTEQEGFRKEGVQELHARRRFVGGKEEQDESRGTIAFTSHPRGGVGKSEALRNLIESELTQLPIFKECSHACMQKLSESVNKQPISVGHAVCVAGDNADNMIVVLRGSIDVLVHDEAVDNLSGGQYFGESLLVGLEDSWGATLICAAPSLICRVGRKEFFDCLATPAFAEEEELFLTIYQENIKLITDGILTNRCPFFHGLSERSLALLDHYASRRIYFPTQRIQTEGDNGGELYILVQGRVGVEMAGRTIRVEQRNCLDDDDDDDEDFAPSDSAPVCFGEVAFLGLQKVHCVSVVAHTVCHIRIVHQQVLLKILDAHHEALHHSVMSQVMTEENDTDANQKELVFPPISATVFEKSAVSEEFLAFLSNHIEPCFFLSGQTIADTRPEGNERDMHLLSRGNATATFEGKEAQMLEAGAIFGRMDDLGHRASPPDAIITATGVCCTQVLHQSVVARGLELYPDQRMIVLNSLTLRTNSGNSRAESFKASLGKSAFFKNMNPDFLEELGNNAIDRILMPGEMIIREGQKGDSMFIMVLGQGTIFVANADKFVNEREQKVIPQERDEEPRTHKSMKARRTLAQGMLDLRKTASKVGMLTPGAICGELAMLGVSETRSASIQAATICILWEVTQERALSILERYPTERTLFGEVIVKNLEQSVPVRMMTLPLFRVFDRKFRVLLSLYCERLACFPEHQVVREGEHGDRLYCPNLGVCLLQKKGFTIKAYIPGTCFGIENMLGLSKVYVGSLTAVVMCHILAIPRNSYLLALEQYPSGREAKDLQHTQRIIADEARTGMERTIARKRIWQRYQNILMKDLKNACPLDLQRRCCQAWHKVVQRQIEMRKKHEFIDARREEDMQHWLQKTVEGRKRVQRHRRLKEIIKTNISSRGPMVYLDSDDDYDADGAGKFATDVDTCVVSSKDGKGTTQLDSTCTESERLVAIIKEWPEPRPSPHYDLRLWDVLSQTLSKPGEERHARFQLPQL